MHFTALYYLLHYIVQTCTCHLYSIGLAKCDRKLWKPKLYMAYSQCNLWLTKNDLSSQYCDFGNLCFPYS